MPGSSQPFDDLARDYDSGFSRTVLGRLLRGRTQAEMARIFHAGDHVLEINCGTGEDAIFLAQRGIAVTATDASTEMLKYAREKIERLALGTRVSLGHCRFEDLDSALEDHLNFDGVVSNFGGLNCCTNLEGFAEKLSRRVRSGGYLFLCIMGRFVPWEWWYLGCRGKFAKAWHRIRGKALWRGMELHYFTPRTVINCFSPYCRPQRLSGLGFLLPPTYAVSTKSGYTSLLRSLNACEERLQSVPTLACVSDHFMLVLQRK